MDTFFLPHGDRDMWEHIFFRYLHGKEKDGAAGKAQVCCPVACHSGSCIPWRVLSNGSKGTAGSIGAENILCGVLQGGVETMYFLFRTGLFAVLFGRHCRTAA